MGCSVCYEIKGLTPVVSKILGGREVKLNLCPKHLERFDRGHELKIKKEDWRDALCCATPINENGHCRICGCKVID